MNDGPRILLVEDPSPKLEALAAALRSRGYAVDCESTESRALGGLVDGQPDLMLLDLSTRAGLGGAFCRNVRREHDVPIIALAAFGEQPHLRAVLEAGASSFVTRPLNLDQLCVRIRVALAVSRPELVDVATEPLEAGPVIIHQARRMVFVRGHQVEFQRLEYELLAALASRPGRLVSRGELVALLWPDRQEGPNNLGNLINRIRLKIETDPHRPRHVLTVRRVGYYFESGTNFDAQ